jgi:hypothetical protein
VTVTMMSAAAGKTAAASKNVAAMITLFFMGILLSLLSFQTFRSLKQAARPASRSMFHLSAGLPRLHLAIDRVLV